jgi:type IV pilus assembly protein PilE
LIEVMIAVAVLAVIAAIAVPSYQGVVRKSRRAEATAALNAAMQAQERWRTNNAGYCTLLTAAASADPPGLAQPGTTANGYYTMSMEAASVSATGYTIVATAVAGTTQAGDGDCATLRVRMSGGNISYGSASAAWDDNASKKCWVR